MSHHHLHICNQNCCSRRFSNQELDRVAIIRNSLPFFPILSFLFSFCNFGAINEWMWWKFSQLSLPWLFAASGPGVAWKLLVQAKTCFLHGQNLQKLAGLYSAFKLQTLSTRVSWKLASSPRHNYYAAGKKNTYMMAGTKEKSQRKSIHLTIIGCSLLSETTRSVRFLLCQTRQTCFSS